MLAQSLMKQRSARFFIFFVLIEDDVALVDLDVSCVLLSNNLTVLCVQIRLRIVDLV